MRDNQQHIWAQAFVYCLQRFPVLDLHDYDKTTKKKKKKINTRLVTHLGVEGSGCSCSRWVRKGCMREAWSQLCGVQRVRSPGIWRCWDQCCPCQIIWGSTGYENRRLTDLPTNIWAKSFKTGNMCTQYMQYFL